jgi:Xaa-Pro aminopeptidase
VQRELLEPVLQYRNELLKRIRPGVTPEQIRRDAREAMQPYLARRRFSKPIYEQAVRRMVDQGSGAFSHQVGLAVHDVGTYRDQPLRTGLVFSVDPTLRVPEENLYMRYEDTVAVTETGVDNFTDFLPSELNDLEALTRQKGIVQIFPPKPGL